MDDALVESARGAVSALLPIRFPEPLAEPGVPFQRTRLSTVSRGWCSFAGRGWGSCRLGIGTG